MAQHNTSATAGQVPIERIPAQILESFFPGFGLASQFFAAFLGIDLASVLYSCFVIVAVVVAAQWSWQKLLLIKDDWFTSSITITSNDKLFGAVMDYLSKMVMEKSRTRYLAAISKNSAWVSRGYPFDCSDSSDDDDDNDTDGDESTQETDAQTKRRAGGPNYGPALGNHWFWHKGNYFGFQREKEGQKQGLILQQSKEILTINCLGRSTEPIKKLLRECQDLARQEDRSKMKVCSSARYSWGRPHLRDPRPLDTIYMDHSVKEDLLNDLKRFLAPNRARYYRRRGIPYRRGYLLHGPPGTGKTSLVSALAGRLHLELHVLNLMDQGMDEDDLVNLFRELPRRSIVLIEDIDTVGLKRRILPQDFEDDNNDEEKKEDEKEQVTENKTEAKPEEGATPKKFSLSGLLNVIDGIASQEGRILIVTSNNPEALDAALVRPGRIDKQIYLGNLNKSSAKEMFMRMYESDPTPLPSKQGSKVPSKNSSSSSLSWDMAADTELDRLASEFADALPDSKLSPAEVQGFLLSYEDEPTKAVGAVTEWAEDVIKAREKRKNIVDKPKA